jgi:CheY-like chemotaxis protein
MKLFRILLVEDDPMLGELLAEMLEEMGHVVVALETTERGAVTAAAQHRPDLMIVDARLGKGSGTSAVDEILRSGFIPHVFTSGNISKLEGLRPDAVVLEKPFREAELGRAIHSATNFTTPA